MSRRPNHLPKVLKDIITQMKLHHNILYLIHRWQLHLNWSFPRFHFHQSILFEYYSWLFPRFTPDGTALQSVYEAFRFTESYGVSLDNCHFCDWLCDNGDPLGDLPVQCEVLPWSLWTGNFHSVFIYIIYIYLLGIVHLSFLLGKGYV